MVELVRIAGKDAVASGLVLFSKITMWGAPLGKGWMKDFPEENGGITSCIVCPYHGWAFDSEGGPSPFEQPAGRSSIVGVLCFDAFTGKVREVPSLPDQERLPRRQLVETYPVAEKGGFVWLFFGSNNYSGFHIEYQDAVNILLSLVLDFFSACYSICSPTAQQDEKGLYLQMRGLPSLPFQSWRIHPGRLSTLNKAQIRGLGKIDGRAAINSHKAEYPQSFLHLTSCFAQANWNLMHPGGQSLTTRGSCTWSFLKVVSSVEDVMGGFPLPA
eukprot:1160217-Pelagomonas_calceolata.AAC.2